MDFREHAGLTVHEGDEGVGRVTADAGEQHLNPHGSVHGGLLATMLDTAMGTAVRAAGGEQPVTVSLTITYLDPGRPGPLTATARVRKRGKRLTVVEGEVVQDGEGGPTVLADLLTEPVAGGEK